MSLRCQDETRGAIMSEQHNQSEVARFRAQIETEHQACMLALYGLSSGNAQHAFISKRMRNMDVSYKALEKIIGEEKATDILCEVFDTTPNRLLTDERTSLHPGDSDATLPRYKNQARHNDIYQAYQSGLLSDEEMARIVQSHTK
jgi:hypothetical protein